MAPLLSVRNLSTGYGKKQVLFDVRLDVMPGEILLITGGNGSGKSTLLKAIYGLLPPWNADAEIIFHPASEGPPVNTQQPFLNLRNGLAYLPQKNAVFDDLTAEDNLRLAGHTLPNRNEFAVRRDEILTFLPALKPLWRRKPEKMSGGERQIVALAIVLLHRPRLLLLDEPLAGLDAARADSILEKLWNINDKQGVTMILVENRILEVGSLAFNHLHLSQGTLTMRTTLKTNLIPS